MSSEKNGLTYAQAGVDIDAGNRTVDLIKHEVRSTRRPGTDSEIGGFGAFFDLKAAGFKDPLLVATTDGVGTKVKIAVETGRHDTIGIDLVAMCVNDLVVQGAEPLFFLDYYATGKLEPEVAASVVAGIARGCRDAGCALIGGETAEMPGLYAGRDFDLAGFAVGAVERNEALPRAGVAEGDVLLGLRSSGLHSNGFSLVRRIIEVAGADLSAPAPFDRARSLAETLLVPTRIYVRSVLGVLASGRGLKALAHITGGGLVENIPRALPHHLACSIDLAVVPVPPVMRWLAAQGQVPAADLIRTFNCGIGMVAIADQGEAEAVASAFEAAGESIVVLGQVTAHHGHAPRVALQGALCL